MEAAYDVLVLGAGVAGASCAVLLARRGLKVALLDRTRPEPDAPHRPDWVSAQFMTFLKDLGLARVNLGAEPFKGAAFHDADLTRVVICPEKPPPAFRVDYARLVCRILERAGRSGVECLPAGEPHRLEAGEQTVVAEWPGRQPVRARFLVRADGAAGMPASAAGQRWLARMCIPVKPGRPDQHLHWVLGAAGQHRVLTWWFDRQGLVINLAAPGPAGAVRADLTAMVGRAAQTFQWPIGPEADLPEISLCAEPGQSALDFDSHVSKNTLRIGAAGGFVATATGQGIYPATWSAFLAAEVLAEAARSTHSQDALQQFDTLWRTQMGQYLSSPRTDTPFLWPLVFSNPRMAARLARALWRGIDV